MELLFYVNEKSMFSSSFQAGYGGPEEGQNLRVMLFVTRTDTEIQIAGEINHDCVTGNFVAIRLFSYFTIR
jgi:hypothetical protein